MSLNQKCFLFLKSMRFSLFVGFTWIWMQISLHHTLINLGICLNTVFIKSLVPVFHKQLSCLFLKDKECLFWDWCCTILSYSANLYSEMYISIHLFPLSIEIKLNSNGWKAKYVNTISYLEHSKPGCLYLHMLQMQNCGCILGKYMLENTLSGV